MHKVMMPRIDPAMQTGKIVEWLKREGDRVERGEPILLVEGEKTTFEVEAPGSGVLRKILYESGADVPVAAVVAMIGEPDEPIPLELEEPKEELRPAEAPTAPEAVEHKPEEAVRASPAARRLAEEYGVDISRVRGTGPGGRIVREDVLRAVEELRRGAPPAPLAKAPRILRAIPLTGIRRTISERLSYSFRTTVPVTLMVDVDMGNALKLREEAGEGTSTTAIIVKAAAKALEDHRELNSTLEDGRIKVFEDISVAIAVHTSQGLVAPVIHNADKLSLREVSRLVRELTDKANAGKLSIAELTGGTFTVTNLGGFGVDTFAPVINPPQCAILGVGRIADKPAVRDGAIVARPVTSLCLVFDHRIIDGAPAAKFLRRVKELLENPEQLLR